MTNYVVVEYDKVDVRRMQDQRPRSAPGSPREATIAAATNEAEAIELVASGSEGYFSAFLLPSDLKLIKAELVFSE